MSYCRFANSLPAGSSDPNKHYHDHVYGFAVADDKELFERLVLEINQAGLSWTLILRKQRAFQAAYRRHPQRPPSPRHPSPTRLLQKLARRPRRRRARFGRLAENL